MDSKCSRIWVPLLLTYRYHQQVDPRNPPPQPLLVALDSWLSLALPHTISAWRGSHPASSTSSVSSASTIPALAYLQGRVIGEEIDTQLLLAHPQLELNLVGDDNDETTAVHHHPRFHLRLDARPADEEDRTPYDWQMHVPCDAPRPSRFALVLKAMDLASASTYGGRFNVNAVDSGWKMAAMWALEKGCDGGDGVGIEEGTCVECRISQLLRFARTTVQSVRGKAGLS